MIEWIAEHLLNIISYHKTYHDRVEHLMNINLTFERSQARTLSLIAFSALLSLLNFRQIPQQALYAIDFCCKKLVVCISNKNNP